MRLTRWAAYQLSNKDERKTAEGRKREQSLLGFFFRSRLRWLALRGSFLRLGGGRTSGRLVVVGGGGGLGVSTSSGTL